MRGKRVSKAKTLKLAIQYITHLSNILSKSESLGDPAEPTINSAFPGSDSPYWRTNTPTNLTNIMVPKFFPVTFSVPVDDVYLNQSHTAPQIIPQWNYQTGFEPASTI